MGLRGEAHGVGGGCAPGAGPRGEEDLLPASPGDLTLEARPPFTPDSSPSPPRARPPPRPGARVGGRRPPPWSAARGPGPAWGTAAGSGPAAAVGSGGGRPSSPGRRAQRVGGHRRARPRRRPPARPSRTTGPGRSAQAVSPRASPLCARSATSNSLHCPAPPRSRPSPSSQPFTRPNRRGRAQEGRAAPTARPPAGATAAPGGAEPPAAPTARLRPAPCAPARPEAGGRRTRAVHPPEGHLPPGLSPGERRRPGARTVDPCWSGALCSQIWALREWPLVPPVLSPAGPVSRHEFVPDRPSLIDFHLVPALWCIIKDVLVILT